MTPTGEIAEEPGIYSSDCHEKKIAVQKQSLMPRCPDCQQPTNWRLIQITR